MAISPDGPADYFRGKFLGQARAGGWKSRRHLRPGATLFAGYAGYFPVSTKAFRPAAVTGRARLACEGTQQDAGPPLSLRGGPDEKRAQELHLAGTSGRMHMELRSQRSWADHGRPRSRADAAHRPAGRRCRDCEPWARVGRPRPD